MTDPVAGLDATHNSSTGASADGTAVANRPSSSDSCLETGSDDGSEPGSNPGGIAGTDCGVGRSDFDDSAPEDAENTVVGTTRTLRVGHDRPIRISAGHRLLHHDGKCARPHGHNYEIAVTVEGTLTPEGWVADKGDITAVLDQWDHMFLLEDGDPLIDAFEASGDADSLVVLEHPPTAEVMSVVLERKLAAALPSSVAAVTVEVSETSELCGGGQ